ncbi:hypothetical protein H4R18_004546 [Coemansia javaensis]|uniref:Kinesin-like protein n=1 Tax=Coemansia javaensis TaxID=2761396 RepID=A0A9W8H3Y9_9FUNG|nr:hypothetical protein H4R18_004546 [Coemansia javaensis]
MSGSGHKIKVVCRVRPFLKTETPDESVSVESDRVLRATNPRDSTKDTRFKQVSLGLQRFDACYGPTVGQDVIYKNDVRPLVETVFSGMSATVFCYGVTGAGKTHTIQGTEADPGIIPRALEQIFRHQARDAVDYDIRVSYFEIYKEAVFDLLKPREATAALPIREDASRRIFVAGLSEKKVASYEQFAGLYQRACGNRRTASTKLNNHSSRSHAILTVSVQWKDDISAGKMWRGKLHLIDLAGSEDNRRTENGRDRMAESSAINRSLFVLGQVVEALNTGATRIPYRDSKMTRILQDSLGGDSLGMMIVNVSPGEGFLQDTHNTLGFATRSREVVNKPVAHEVVEQRWTAADRLQHHRGAALPARTAVVPAGAGLKRRRSDEPSSTATAAAAAAGPLADEEQRHQAHSQPVSVSGGDRQAARRSAAGVRQPQFQIQRPPAGADLASNAIMERVLRIEKQLSSKSLDADVVLDLFTPATKLKTSRGWLKHARELEQKGDLERALAHYEEALRYAPELNKLEAHIAKVRARIRRQKRRSSIASHGQAGVRVADQKPAASDDNDNDNDDDDDDEEDVGHLWMRDGLAESPGAEKAERRRKRAAMPKLKPAAPFKLAPRAAPKAAPARPAANGGSTENSGEKPAKRRRVLGGVASVTEGSVHDRRISFGGAQLNPFVVNGSAFDSDLQRRLEQRRPIASTPARRLVAKSAAAARLHQSLAEPPTPVDRSDRDFVPPSDDDDDDDGDDASDDGRPRPPKKQQGRRLPGALGVRGLVEQRRRAEEDAAAAATATAGRPPKSPPPPPPRRSSGAEAPLELAAFNEICIASALQMINSAEVKKIMKLQGIGKRRAEQIQESVQADGPLKHVSELQTRLHFKNKLVMGILSTFA